MLRAASTNSRSRSDSVCPRTIRPMYGQPKKPITQTSTATRDHRALSPNSSYGRTETSAIEKSNWGKASRKSITRLITESTQPPRKPAARPKATPRMVETSAERKATVSEVCAP